MISHHHKKTLASSLLFQSLSDPQCQTLFGMGKTKQFKRKEVLYLADAPVTHFFFLLEGKIKEYYIGADGNESIIRVSHPYEYLGLPCLFLMDNNHTSYGEAVSTVEVIQFSVKPFVKILEQVPALTRNVLTLMSCRLECARRQRCFSQKMSAECRVANYLLNQTDKRFVQTCTSCCRLTHQAVNLQPLNLSAQEIGLARETFTRILSRLKQNGIIDLDHGKVQLLNRQVIEDLASHIS